MRINPFKFPTCFPFFMLFSLTSSKSVDYWLISWKGLLTELKYIEWLNLFDVVLCSLSINTRNSKLTHLGNVLRVPPVLIIVYFSLFLSVACTPHGVRADVIVAFNDVIITNLILILISASGFATALCLGIAGLPTNSIPVHFSQKKDLQANQS